MVINGVAVPAAVIAGAERFVADLPILDADRRRPIDSQERIEWLIKTRGLGPTLIGSGTRACAQLCPIAGSLPIVALLIDTDRHVVWSAEYGWISIGIGDPGGRFLRLSTEIGHRRLAIHQFHRRAI